MFNIYKAFKMKTLREKTLQKIDFIQKRKKSSTDKVERQAVLILKKRFKTLRNELQMDKQDIRLIKALKSNYHRCKEELISMIANLLS